MRQFLYFKDPFFTEEIRKCFLKEEKEIVRSGNLFINYFLENCTLDGILFKTIKEIATELEIPYQDIIAILRILEERAIIYRRNGIIAFRKQN